MRGGIYDPILGERTSPYWGYPYDWDSHTLASPIGRTRTTRIRLRRLLAVKTDVTPKQTEVYVDGYYAGVADDFDGAFKRLHTSPWAISP